MPSKTTYYRRLRKAKELGCSPEELPDNRGKHGHQLRGKDHPRWNNGQTLGSNGYIKINVGKSHPLADPNGYAYLHFLVWFSFGKPAPRKGEIIHHIDQDKTNNRIENLVLLTSSDHIKLHEMMRKDQTVIDGQLVKEPEPKWLRFPEVR